MFCPKCGNELNPGALFCDKCGTGIENAQGGNGTRESNKMMKGLVIALAGIVVALVVVMIIILANNKPSNDANPVSENTNTETGTEPVAETAPTESPTPTPEPTLSPEESDYQEAIALLEDKQYGKAAKAFKKLGEYEDSKENYKKSQYMLGKKYYKSKKYKKAKKIFDNLKTYKSSKKLYNKCVVKIFTAKTPGGIRWICREVARTEGDGEGENYSLLTIRWNKVDGADGYEVSYYKNYDGGDKYNRGYTKKNYLEDKYWSDITSEMHIKIRAYKKLNGKINYTRWSAVSQSPWNW